MLTILPVGHGNIVRPERGSDWADAMFVLGKLHGISNFFINMFFPCTSAVKH